MNGNVFRGPSRKGKRWFHGFTLVELLVVIAIMAILSALAISKFNYLLPGVRQITSTDTAELLNRAVDHYDQVNAQITVPVSADANDELAVVALLKTRSAAAPGSPYLQADVTVIASASPDQVRLVWTGKLFNVIPEGTPGTGIAVDQQ